MYGSRIESSMKDGCEYFPSCLDCKLRQCRYDYASGHAKGEINRDRVKDLASQGMSTADISAALHMNKRTVYRLLSEGGYHGFV